ncbi:MAG: SurA N-terminal domain-containing protein [Deltaproteobacteria bacterium]|nr:SurA N-terminal domain-containing protein [Deltaproteobacteria bacterium]
MKGQSVPARYFSFLVIMCSLVWGVVAGYAEPVDRIVAIVNDDCIALSELQEALVPYVKQIRAASYSPQVEREMIFKLRQDILNRIIDQKLTQQETERQKVNIGDKEIDQHIERIKSQHLLTDEELRASLARDGLTLEEYREKVKQQILMMTLINIKIKSKIAITDKDIREYYEAHKADYEGTRKYHLRSILIGEPPSDDTDMKMAALIKGEHAGGGVAVAGGDLGLFTLDELSTEFRETVRPMAEGEASPVLETPNGYQILVLQEIKEIPGKTLKDAGIEIHEKLYKEFEEAKYNEWVKELRERAYIKITL